MMPIYSFRNLSLEKVLIAQLCVKVLELIIDEIDNNEQIKVKMQKRASLRHYSSK